VSKRLVIVLSLILLGISTILLLLKLLAPSDSNAPDSQNPQASSKKVLYIDAYHAGYQWGDKEFSGAQSVLSKAGITPKRVFLDSNRHTDDPFLTSRAEEIKNEIITYQPDVIISADDAPLKYVIMPFFKNTSLPVVFCGVNWDSSSYQTPYSNMTGMIEVSLVPELLTNIKTYAKGNRIGWIGGDVLTNRKEPVYIKKFYNISMLEKYPKTMAEFERDFESIQAVSDIVFFYNYAGIQDWDDAKAKEFIWSHTKKPTITTLDFMTPYVLLGYTKIAEEQGEWAATTALSILDGKLPSQIPESKNKKGQLFINLPIAKNLGIVFSSNLLKTAQVIKK